MLHPSTPTRALRAVGVVLFSLCCRLPAQSEGGDAHAAPELRTRVKGMMRLALREGQAWPILADLCRTAPKRLSGSEGAEAAVAWAEAKMKALGLSNVRRETFLVPRWVRGSRCEVEVVAPPEIAGTRLSACALGGSVATPKAGVEATVIEVRNFAELRKAGERARGRILFCNRPFDLSAIDSFNGYGRTVNQRGQGAVEGAKAGAVACLVRSVSPRDHDAPHTGAMGYRDGVEKIPAAALSVRAANRLHDLLAKHGELRLRFVQDCKSLDEVPSSNVIGEIPGRELPEEIVLIGAHLDGWDLADGAHDDGSGCAHCLEAVRLILATGVAPRRTLRVCLYMNEENGLRGGRDYARRHEKAMDRHILAIESDRGGFAPRGFGVSGGKKVQAALEPVARLLAVYDLGDLRPGFGGADIGTLRPYGVPLMGLRVESSRYFDHHHAATDLLETVHPRELQLGAAAMAIMAFGVAEAEAPLPRAQKAPRRGR